MSYSPSALPGKTDVLIIGGGAAGLSAALECTGLDVTVLAKAPVGEGASSALAQGGVAAAVAPEDKAEDHSRDTHKAGAGLCDPQAVGLLTGLGRQGIERLVKLGMVFDRTEDGSFQLSREAAHGCRRVLHAHGDGTGRELMRALGAAVTKAAHVRVVSGATAEELIIEKGRVCGAWVADEQGHLQAVMARAVVLATGGIGQLFAKTTNPETATGDGLAMAAEAGAVIADPEFVQFHPTAIDVQGGAGEPLPLATEALRGEGAELVDGKGVRFMTAVHDDAELAPRDVVARAIWRQRAQGRKVFLDARKAVGERFPEQFPTVFGLCMEAGIDPRKQPIPVVPAVHYHMGGVAVDGRGRTSLDGLWACGEVAATGVHGANRLASNSLLEAVVFGPRVAEDILASALPNHPETLESARQDNALASGGDEMAWRRLRALAYEHLGVMREEAGLRLLMEEASGLMERVPTRAVYRAASVLLIASAAALARKESRGAHFRADCPELSATGPMRTFITLEDARRLAATGDDTVTFGTRQA